jgi:hypothetical protein
MIQSLNSMNSQVTAVVLILLGIGCFGLACLMKTQAAAQGAVITAGTSLIAGALAFLNKREADSNNSNPTNPALPGEKK